MSQPLTFDTRMRVVSTIWFMVGSRFRLWQQEGTRRLEAVYDDCIRT